MIRKIYFLLVSSLFFVSCTACGKNGTDAPGPDPVEPVIVNRYGADMSFESTILGTKVRYSIYLPKDYETAADKKYPVVYLLHGYGDNNKSWNDQWLNANALIRSLEYNGLGDMIYVFPYGMNYYWCNRYNGKFNLMDMFVEELIPHIDKTFRTIPDRAHRCVTGYSMGGFGAAALAEKHPEMFLCSAPLSMSFRTDSQYMSEGPQSAWENQWGSIFGGIGCTGEARLTDYYKQHCPFHQFIPENKEKLSAVKWFFTCGDNEEQLLIAADALHIQMRDYGFDHEYRVGEGGHEGSYWQTALKEVLPMFWFYMNGGDKWQGQIEVPEIKPVTFAQDGTLCSAAYAKSGTGDGIYFVYDSSSADAAAQMRDIMAIFYGSSSASFVCLPCDLSQKTFDQWAAFYDTKFTLTAKRAFAMGENCKAVIGKGLKTLNLVNPVLPSGFAVASGTSYHFACTDSAPCYKDAGLLYKLCKEGGVDFEYRVIKGANNSSQDVLRCASAIKSYYLK